jgi:hypothetical protein
MSIFYALGQSLVISAALCNIAWIIYQALYPVLTIYPVVHAVEVFCLGVLLVKYVDLKISSIELMLRSVAACLITSLLCVVLSLYSLPLLKLTDFIQENSGETIMAFLIGGLAWNIFRLVIPHKSKENCQPSHSSMLSYSMGLYNKIGPWTKLRLWDAQMVSAHEAGHAVVLGLLPYHEKNLEVVMKASQEHGFDGYCKVNGWSSRSHSMTFLELRMISFLAGVEAEKICTGERSVSGTSDYERFIELATHYLCCSELTLFYLNPKDELESAYNRSKILELRERLQHVVRNLLIENREILEVIRQKLIDKGRVRGSELIDLVTKVRPVPGCPVISDFLREAMREDVIEADKLEETRAVG